MAMWSMDLYFVTTPPCQPPVLSIVVITDTGVLVRSQCLSSQLGHVEHGADEAVPVQRGSRGWGFESMAVFYFLVP